MRIESSVELVDFAADPFDGAIRATNRVGPGLIGHELVKAEFTPMMSPALVEEYDIREPADLLRVPMISPDDHWLPAWFKMAGVEGDFDSVRSFARLRSQGLEAAAAMAGRGFAMLTAPFYADEIAAGRLVQPFEAVGWDGHAYYFVYPESRRNWPKIRAFRDWIVAATQPLRDRQRSGA